MPHNSTLPCQRLAICIAGTASVPRNPCAIMYAVALQRPACAQQLIKRHPTLCARPRIPAPPEGPSRRPRTCHNTPTPRLQWLAPPPGRDTIELRALCVLAKKTEVATHSRLVLCRFTRELPHQVRKPCSRLRSPSHLCIVGARRNSPACIV